MAINQFQGNPAGITGIAQALEALGSVYKMKQASTANELLQQQVNSGKAQAELLGQQREVGSDTSKKAQAGRGALLNTLIDKGYLTPANAKPLLDQLNQTSAYDLNNDNSFGPIMEYMKGEQTAKGVAARNQSRETGNAITTGKDYDDKMSQYVQVNNDVKKVDSIFNTKDKNGKPLITPQQLGDANLAVSRLYSPTHQSDSTMSQTEYESAPAKFAEALQKYTADPTDIGSRDLVAHIVDQAHHLANVSNQNASTQLDNLHAGYMAIPDTQVQGVAKSKYGNYSKLFSKQYKTMGSDVPADGPPQAAAQAPDQNQQQNSSGIHIPNDSIQAEIAKRSALKQQAAAGSQNAAGP